MHTRLLFGTVRPGRLEDARKIFAETADKVKRQYPGCLLIQVLESGQDIVAFTSWGTREELARYAAGDLAKEHFARLAPLLMGAPSVKSYEVTYHYGR